MIAMIGTSDRPCWLAEACKIHLLLLLRCGKTFGASDDSENKENYGK